MKTCYLYLLLTCLVLPVARRSVAQDAAELKPNILFILTDDHRWDSVGAALLQSIRTPHLDSLAESGTRFENAFVTLAICSPSRAACLTGRYGSANGVTSFGKVSLDEDETTFAHALRRAGYATGVTGKWHLKDSPQDCGFDFASTCWSNGTWYDRRFTIDGESKIMPGFVDDVVADESIRFIRQTQDDGKPFMLWLCTQVPHMDNQHTWPAKQEYLDRYDSKTIAVPKSWNDSLEGKPQYLKTARNRTRATEYGYDNPINIRNHTRDYRASVEQMDASLGRVLNELNESGLRDNTWIIFMGDNGWLLGEHGMTSKVLPYEESMRVPMVISGPETTPRVSDHLVLNIDLTATIYELAGLEIPTELHGRSLTSIVAGQGCNDWRTSFLYEAPTSQLGSQPLWAVRNRRWKYIETTPENSMEPVAELYDLEADEHEIKNVVTAPQNRAIVTRLVADLRQLQSAVASESTEQKRAAKERTDEIRSDIHISGVYPHLTTYGVYSQGGAHYKDGHNECGIGAIVPWAGKLWMVNYAPHMPRGSEHKLYSVDEDLAQPLTIHPESVGGTPAGRMIHAESNQLLIGHHVIDADGNVRSIQPSEMPIRVTAIARHLSDPANLVYYIDMEGSIWEVNVHTLDAKQLFKKPVPGWHGKGGYTSQGRLVVSNNGEHKVGDYKDLQVGGPPETPDERGVLAEFDGEEWNIVERRQFTEVTGPAGVAGGSDGDDPIWSMGWDRRSVRLKVLDNGQWHTYLLPKAAFCNDARHGWYTEWPRIREITDGRWMMDMHGMFFDFPKSFSAGNSAGIQPIGSHLRYVPDFCGWNGKLVLATDETSIQGNRLAGQPQSNLWFGTYEDLASWGPANGYGGPWIEDEVKANVASDPFLVAGFDRRVIHFATGRRSAPETQALRATDQQPISKLPMPLAELPRVTIRRGDWHQPAPRFEFTVNRPVTIFLAVDRRGDPQIDAAWKRTKLSLTWGKGFQDDVYAREFAAGKVVIPANTTEHTRGSFGMPHTAFVQATDGGPIEISVAEIASVTDPAHLNRPTLTPDAPVNFALEIDERGTGRWTHFANVNVPGGGNATYYLPNEFEAEWLRFRPDRDCVATVVLHQTTSRFVDGTAPGNTELFAGLANIEDSSVVGGQVYAAKRNRNLRILSGNQHFEFTKNHFEFERSDHDPKLEPLLRIEPEFTVDAASVILKSEGRTYRLPKGPAAYDKPFSGGWPRASREVESERHLANIHGTFYEIPLITNGSPPAWNRMRPVSSHQKQIMDFCSWNGLLVLTGVGKSAREDGHVFRNPELNTALWFGGIDDLWKLGKPQGQGGPWLDSPVTANVPSDAYLMTGYDRKTVRLSHSNSSPVTMTLEADITGEGLWVKYKRFVVAADETLIHEFPIEYSAHWIRAVSDVDTTATVQFEYQ